MTNITIRYLDSSHGHAPYSISLHLKSLHVRSGELEDPAAKVNARPPSERAGRCFSPTRRTRTAPARVLPARVPQLMPREPHTTFLCGAISPIVANAIAAAGHQREGAAAAATRALYLAPAH